jgi:hypothetical protein
MHRSGSRRNEYFGRLTRSCRGCDWRVCWWTDKAIEYRADNVMRQAPSHAWCPTIALQPKQGAPYSLLFLAFCRIFSYPFSPPRESTKSWSLPRPRDYPRSWTQCKKTSNLYIAAKPRGKPGIGDPHFSVYRAGSCTMRWGCMRRMWVHAQDVTGLVFRVMQLF